MNEEWKIISHSPNYEVSNFGNVRHILRKVNLKPRPVITFSHTRYDVSIANETGFQRNQKVHRLVAEAFLPNPENKPIIDHIDGNSENNHISNLRWVTKSENGLNRNNKLRKDNISGHKGICFCKQKNKWKITYQKDGKSIHGGFYDTKEEAIANYKNPFEI